MAQQYSTKKYSTNEHINSIQVYSLFQDSKGFQWIGSENGLNKFDGKKFIDFSKKFDSESKNIESIIQDKNNTIWFGSNKDGILSYQNNQIKQFNLGNEENNKINSLFEDSQGNILAASKGAGILKFNGKGFDALQLPVTSYYSIEEDPNGILFFGSVDSGIFIYANNKLRKRLLLPTDAANSVYCMKHDKASTLYIGTAGNGVYNYKEGVLTQMNIPEISRDVIYEIIIDVDKNLWIATGNSGVVHYYTKTNTYDIITRNNGLSSNSITSLMQDNEQNIWIGTLNSGVCVLNINGFLSYTKESGIDYPEISNINTIGSNYYLSTLNDGLYLLQNKSMTHLAKYEDFNNSSIVTTLADNQKLWIGTTSGAFIFENGKITQPPFLKKLENMAVVSILKDKKGTIWISTYGSGLFKLTTNGLENITTKQGLPTNNIYTAFFDSNGMLWLGTFQYGIVKYNGETFTQFTQEKNNLPENTILSICEDKIGNMYFGTEDGGLTCYDGRTFSNITEKDGLSSDNVYAIAVDQKGILWAGTDAGVNKIELTASFKAKSIKHYSIKDGMCGNDILQNGFYLSNDGMIWMASTSGVSVYNTLKERENTTLPKLWISEILLDNQPVDWTTFADSIDSRTQLPVGLKLKHNQNQLYFKFQALSIQSVKFSWILEGLKKSSWNQPSENTEFNTGPLDPGNYTFKLKAQNNDGYWTKESYEFSFTILENPFKTSLAYASYATAALLLIIGIFRYQTSRLEKRNKLLEYKVNERTQELSVAHNKLSYAYTDIKDSIEYAKQIQDALLPVQEDLNKLIPSSFILYKPRDVVSGDFYWFTSAHNKTYIAAVDCTGHGVPGAFMSMIGNTLLNEIIAEGVAQEPAAILNQLNTDVKKSLKQDREGVDSKDGMDLALIALSKKEDATTYTIEYSGAKRPLYMVRKNNDGVFELTEIKPDKLSIGGSNWSTQTLFTNNILEVSKGDQLYIFTDGYADQFGGEKSKKITSKRLQQLILSNAHLPMRKQKDILFTYFTEWKGNTEQIDDVLIIGITI